MKPLDEATVLASVRKTGRAVLVHEAAAPCGVGAALAALIVEKAFRSLRAPVFRRTAPDAPSPHHFLSKPPSSPTPTPSSPPSPDS